MDKNRKTYHLAQPAAAFYDSLKEEGGELAALDLFSKKLSVEVPIRRLEKQLEEMIESKQKPDIMEELVKRMAQEGLEK